MRRLFLLGLCCFIAGCSTGKFGSHLFLGESKSYLGIRYLLGRGVVQNNSKAFNYFLQAAREGDPFAQNEVAFLYAAGKGTRQNYRNALYYYQKAGQSGLASAQYNVGIFYLYGLSVPKNKARALLWFRKSAAKGFAPARLALQQFHP